MTRPKNYKVEITAASVRAAERAAAAKAERRKRERESEETVVYVRPDELDYTA